MLLKKNIRNIPKLVSSQLDHLKDQFLVAACLRVYSADKLQEGILEHLGIKLDNTELSIPIESVIPSDSIGKYSNRNTNGYEIIRRDLPKETLYNSIESPNWGDASTYGTHTVNLPYERFPRDFCGPEFLRIKVSANNTRPNQKQYAIMFEVDQVLDRESPDFEAKLLKCLNILQENVGACGVKKSGLSIQDYLKTIVVGWEVLPPGTREEVIERIFMSRKAPSEQDQKTAGERYDFFMRLKPQKLIYGTSGLQRYFGALLENDLVVFENVEYGNAIYIMFNDWQELSKLARTELLSGRYGKNFQRIPHVSGWKNQVKIFVEAHRNKEFQMKMT